MQTTDRTITIKGVGSMSVAPDIIVLDMNLETVETDYEICIQRATELLDSLRSAVVSAGHDGKELKTTSFNVNTKYDGHMKNGEWKKKFIGYACAHGLRLEFESDMKILSATIRAITKCDVKPVINITFSVKDQYAVSEQLLQKAIEDATAKACVLTESTGVALGTILRIDYNWGELHVSSDTDIEYGSTLDCVSEALFMPTDIEPEDIKVKDTVTVIWAIE